MSYLPWLLARDLFGWFTPAILHFWNVAAHVLNTALVAALAWRLGRRFRRHDLAFPATAALLFGLSPLAYEAVLWASALVHPFMAVWGLASVHAYLTARRRERRRAAYLALSAGLLLAACLSHEMGFIFGLLIALVEVACARAQRGRLYPGALLPLAIGLIYPFYYRLFLITKWNTAGSEAAPVGLGDLLANFAYQAQAMLWWLAPLARALFERPEQTAAIAILLAALAVFVGLALFLLWRAGRDDFELGACALLAWGLLALPSSVMLSQGYVLGSPRMTYVPAIGASLFWGVVCAALWRTLRLPSGRVAAASVLAVVLGWGIVYVSEWLSEAARLTPALRQIDADLRASASAARLLILNPSFISNRVQPQFLLGRESMPIWQYPYTDRTAPMWAWPASVSGIVRDTLNVRHDNSIANRETNFVVPDVTFTRGDRFSYGVTGEYADDGKLQSDILASTAIYRFEYDPPGLRGRRVATLAPQDGDSTLFAQFASDGARAMVRSARAYLCGDRLQVDLTWSGVDGMARPVGVFVHVLDAAGQPVLTADRDLLDGILPLDQAPPRTTIAENRDIRAACRVGGNGGPFWPVHARRSQALSRVARGWLAMGGRRSPVAGGERRRRVRDALNPASPSHATSPAALNASPSGTDAGSYVNSTRCVPAGMSTLRNRTSAQAMGATWPSTRAIQPGWHASRTVSRDGCDAVTSTTSCSGRSTVTVTPVCCSSPSTPLRKTRGAAFRFS